MAKPKKKAKQEKAAKDGKPPKPLKPPKPAKAPPSPKGKGGTDLKKAAGQIAEIAKSPAVRELAIAALGAAAAKIAESTKARQKAREETAGGADDQAERVRRQAVHLGEVIRAAALEGARQLLDELERPSEKKAKKENRGKASSRPESAGLE